MSATEARLLGVLAAVVLVPLVLAAGIRWFNRGTRSARSAGRAEPPDDTPNPFGDPD
jgi:hypothetical protein